MEDKALGLLGMMRRARAVETGTDSACDTVRAGKAKLLNAADPRRYGELAAELDKRNEKAVRRKREKTQRADSKRNGKRRTEV